MQPSLPQDIIKTHTKDAEVQTGDRKNMGNAALLKQPADLFRHFSPLPKQNRLIDATATLGTNCAECFLTPLPETLQNLPAEKAVLTGSPIRKELLSGDALKARSFCGFADDKPVILMIGGSLGAVAINECLREALPTLLKRYNVVHLCGKGNLDQTLGSVPGYVQYEYISKELPDLFALADIVLSRAGANAICELQALAKPNLLIPLPAEASRGDQLLNAASFEKQGYSMVLQQSDMNRTSLVEALDKLYENRDQYIRAMQKSEQADAVRTIVGLIEQYKK